MALIVFLLRYKNPRPMTSFESYNSYPVYAQVSTSDFQGTQYRQFHDSLITASPVSKGQVFSGKFYCPEAPVAEGSLDGYQSVNRPRPSYATYESYNRNPIPIYPNLPSRLAYNSFQNFDPRQSLMNQSLMVSRPASGLGTYTAAEAGNSYTRVLGGIQWIDDEPRREGAVVGINNLYSGEQNVQFSYPYSSRATRASYGDINLVGEKFWRDPYTGASSRSYR